MRKPIGLFVAAFATVAGGGLAVAVEGQQGPSGPPEETPPSVASENGQENSESEADPGPPVEIELPEAPEVETEEVETEEVETPEVEEEGEGEHGAWVSDHAENICPPLVEDGTFRNQGQCVSNAARDKDHDGTPDVGRGSPDHPGRGQGGPPEGRGPGGD